MQDKNKFFTQIYTLKMFHLIDQKTTASLQEKNDYFKIYLFDFLVILFVISVSARHKSKHLTC